jgi:hypothetical protein
MEEIYNLFQLLLMIFAFISLFTIPACSYLIITSIINKQSYRDYLLIFLISLVSIPAIYSLFMLLKQIRGY